MAPVTLHVAAAAKVANAERNLIQHLRKAAALSATTSVSLPPIDGLDERHLDRLVQSGIVGRVSGRYYLDQIALDERSQSRRTAGLVALVVVAGAAVVALLVLATRA